MRRTVTVHLVARSASRDVLTARLTTSTVRGAAEHLAFSSSMDSIVYRHEGAPAFYELTLEAPVQNGRRTTFVARPGAVGPNEIATFAPSDWRNLTERPVLLTITRADGSQDATTLSTSNGTAHASSAGRVRRRRTRGA